MKDNLERLYSKDIAIVLAITGGGAQAIAELLKHGGASKNILEATVPYDKAAGIKYIGNTPEKYCSKNYALNLAMESYRRAQAYSTTQRPAMGVGAAAKLCVSGERWGRKHEIWVAIQLDDETRMAHLEFNNQYDQTREGQESACTCLILQMILESQCITMKERGCEFEGALHNEYVAKYIQRATKEISDVFHGIEPAWSSTNHVKNPVLFPGSFDPIHQGHIDMARAAFKLYGKGRYVVLELCIHNPDKAPLDFWRIQERLELIHQKVGKEEWFGGVVVSNLPLFLDKARMLNYDTFMVGRDVFDRVFSRKYAGLYTQQDLLTASIHFIVFDRTSSCCSLDHVDKMLYTIVPEVKYKDSGVSSTAIRREGDVY